MSELTYLDYASAPQDIKDTAKGLVDSFSLDSDLLKGAIVAALLRERLSYKNEEQALVIRELVEALGRLNVTDEELLRIRNGCNSDGDVKIWAKMLQKIVDSVREMRSIARAAIAKAKQP